MSHPPSTVPATHVAADTSALAESAARLRELIAGASPRVGDDSGLLDDASTRACPADSGIGRFLSALSTAWREQEARVVELGRYADGAAGVLEWFAGEVVDAEGSASASSARLGRESTAIA